MVEEITANIVKDVPVPVDGMLTIPDKPGLGLEIAMDFIREHDEA